MKLTYNKFASWVFWICISWTAVICAIILAVTLGGL